MMYLIIKKVEADNVEQAIKKSEKEKIYNCTILPEEKINAKDGIGFEVTEEDD
jgi:hypothetical protein